MKTEKRFVKLFLPCFIDKIKSGQKTTTIRNVPKSPPPAVGDLIDARYWTGNPYRSKQAKIGLYTCTGTVNISLSSTSYTVGGRERQDNYALETLAKNEGFESWAEFWDFFTEFKGIDPEAYFTGILIMWDEEARRDVAE